MYEMDMEATANQVETAHDSFERYALVLARRMRTYYEAQLKAGFNDQQAMQLTIAGMTEREW